MGVLLAWHALNLNVDSMVKDINITNILVSAETQILTKDIGYVPIHQIFNTPTKVWSGEDWVETSARKLIVTVIFYFILILIKDIF